MTDLQELAIAACVKARAEHEDKRPGYEPRVLAIKYLRDMADAEGWRLMISDCVPLIDAAMPRSQSAGDLPDGSVVAVRKAVFIKNQPTPRCEWSGTNGWSADNAALDELLRDGAVVLRVGYGEKGV